MCAQLASVDEYPRQAAGHDADRVRHRRRQRRKPQQNEDGEGRQCPRAYDDVQTSCKEACADVARQIDLGAVLKIGRSEMMTGGRRKQALLGDAMEAVIAALYLDGGLEPARIFIERLWMPLLEEEPKPPQDAKTRLQELLQGRGKPLPKYEMVGRQGPAHSPVFTIELTTGDGESVRAEGKSKREAEQQAAQLMLDTLNYE